MPCWQVSAALHMSPLTTAEAVSAGLITAPRWRLDATHYISHFPDAQQPSTRYSVPWDLSALSAAYARGTVGNFFAEAQARAEADGQPGNGMHTHCYRVIDGRESYSPWLCWIQHFPDKSKLQRAETPRPMRVSDYIAEMQKAADGVQQQAVMAAEEAKKGGEGPSYIRSLDSKT